MTICVSFSTGSARHIRSVLGRLEMAELRLDLLDLKAKEIVGLFKDMKCSLIATCRPGRYDDTERQAFLGTAILAGADYIDIELESEQDFSKPLVQLAKKHKCKVIVSHHDEKKTPDTKVLWKLVNNCFQKGAHIAKIACMVKKPMDNLRLLRLLEGDKPVVVVGMGKEGTITRITAPTLGAPFTYASWEKGNETAPGQLTYKEMVAIYKRMGVDV
jgi:3-dehydroquinate dehydratase type I